VKRLTLRREALAELSTAELTSVLAGVTTTGYYPTLPVTGCDTYTAFC
jgi:hypothetical protein